MSNIAQLIAKHLPHGQIVSIDGHPATPETADEIVQKWSARQAQRGDRAEDAVSILVKLPQQDPPVPASLLRRVLLVDPVRNEVIGTSG